MTLNEFVKTGITNLITQAATLAAAETESPDEAAAIPLAFFALEMELQGAWDKAIEKRANERPHEARQSHRGTM